MRVGTAQEVAALLRVRVETVYQLAQAGELPTLRRIGPRLRFDLDELEGWVRPVKPLTRDGRPRRQRLSRGVDWELSPEQVAHLSDEGYVYFIRAVIGGPVKIGTARNVTERLVGIQSMCPFPLEVLAVCRGGRRREYELHIEFRSDRLHGEWFRPSRRLLGLVEEINGLDTEGAA